MTRLEHINITVSNPDRTAAMLCRLFGWNIRREGDAGTTGRTVHVGSDQDYIALYSSGFSQASPLKSSKRLAGLNHIGLLVDDLDFVEARVRAEGFVPHEFGNYEPGRRFYFYDHDGVEYEIVSYSNPE